MNSSTDNELKFNFFRTYAIPALLLFVIPVFSLWFFQYVQAYFDQQSLASFEQSIQEDASLSTEQRERALEFFRKNPLSKVLASNDPQFDQMREEIEPRLRFDYWTFRWMIRLSITSLVSGVAVLIVAVLSVLFSLRSQMVQYYSLSTGWHVLRVVATAQVLIQGCLALTLSFWVTAFWLERYYVKLIIIAALLAVGAAVMVIRAIFRKPNETFEVEGTVIEREQDSPLWSDLDRLCVAVGTTAPDRIELIIFAIRVPKMSKRAARKMVELFWTGQGGLIHQADFKREVPFQTIQALYEAWKEWDGSHERAQYYHSPS